MKQADELGSKYMGYTDSIKDLVSALNAIKNRIKSLAKKNGSEDGKQVIVRGEQFVVGFIIPEPSEELNIKKLRKLISNEDWLEISSRALDEKKLEKAIRAGNISRSDIAKCMEKSKKKPQERVYVKLIDETGKAIAKKGKQKLGK